MAVGLPSVISSTTLRVATRVGSLKAAAIGTRAVLSASIVFVAPLFGVSAFTLVFKVLIKPLSAKAIGTSGEQMFAAKLSSPAALPQPRQAKLTMPIRSFPVKLLSKNSFTVVFKAAILVPTWNPICRAPASDLPVSPEPPARSQRYLLWKNHREPSNQEI